MNLKYNELSVIGKIWTLAELFFSSVRDGKDHALQTMFKKLEELANSEEAEMSIAVLNNGIANIMENAKLQKQFMIGEIDDFEYFDDGSLIALIWLAKIEFEHIKKRVNDDSLLKDDLQYLSEIYYSIYRTWIVDLKEKELATKERRDLFKIKEEIKSLKVKIQNRVERNQITII